MQNQETMGGTCKKQKRKKSKRYFINRRYIGKL